VEQEMVVQDRIHLFLVPILHMRVVVEVLHKVPVLRELVV
jgi:hypothetical protein